MPSPFLSRRVRNRQRLQQHQSPEAPPSEERRKECRPLGTHSEASPTCEPPAPHTPPASSGPPTGNESGLLHRISLLASDSPAPRAPQPRLCHPSLKKSPDITLMEAILRDSRDQSDTAYHLEQLLFHYSRILGNCRAGKRGRVSRLQLAKVLAALRRAERFLQTRHP